MIGKDFFEGCAVPPAGRGGGDGRGRCWARAQGIHDGVESGYEDGGQRSGGRLCWGATCRGIARPETHRDEEGPTSACSLAPFRAWQRLNVIIHRGRFPHALQTHGAAWQSGADWRDGSIGNACSHVSGLFGAAQWPQALMGLVDRGLIKPARSHCPMTRERLPSIRRLTDDAITQVHPRKPAEPPAPAAQAAAG